MSDAHAFEATAVDSNAKLADAIAHFRTQARTDLERLPDGALAYLLNKAATENEGNRFVIVCPTADACESIAASLRFFAGEMVLRFPPPDTTPFVDVVPDRRAEMQRLATLSHLASGKPWRFLVVPATGLLRRVPPRDALVRRQLSVKVGDEVDRDSLGHALVGLGYLRVPLVEDPGTFSVRGAIIDVFPPTSGEPVRIELDDIHVSKISAFDPDSQKATEESTSVEAHAAREVPDEPDAIARAKGALRELCDDMNIPTIQAKQLAEELDRGSGALVSAGLLPGYYESLETLFDLAGDAAFVMVDPPRIREETSEELERARRDRSAKVADGAPRFEVDAHYLELDELDDALDARRRILSHKLGVADVSSEPADDDAAAAKIIATGEGAVLRLDVADHQLLTAAIRRRSGPGAGLTAVADAVKSWTRDGLRVGFVARTRPQADRLAALLRNHDVHVEVVSDAAAEHPREVVQIVIGDLGSGFVWWSEGIVWMAEEEIFGTRVHRARTKKKPSKRQQARFLEELRELQVGDFVVHVDHGVARYLGLEHKSLGLSAQERMYGAQAKSIEVMVLEYAGADKLFLPVTRLGAIQKFKGKEGATPKLDRLGGTTFATKKGRVRKAVRQMAEELLKLFAERAAAQRPSMNPADSSYTEFEASFPFEETRDQAQAIEDVLADLEGDKPMDRLVCGDVGFGKTEVAMRATFRAAMEGRQVAVLCPTTVLAQQHFRTFRERLDGYPIKVRVLSRFVSRADQQATLAGLRDGTVDVVIGTHRLLSKDVHFANLGLLVVDEEQRFGVTHKERIKKLRARVDVLTLSATPIPRTLQLAVGGLRDLSLIATAPVDRRAVRTFVCRWDDHLIKEAIHRELSRGGQVFFVYNRIDGLYERAERLKELLPEARFAVAHGRMKPAELERSMTDFVEGEYDVLCSTAIVESGLDIPRANTILIDRADALGLAQLYQLKGRVGRSRQRAYCYLITPPPDKMSEESRSRMEALERFSGLGAGFHVAALDMELRGAGDLLGAEQSGNASLVGFDMFVRMLTDAVAEMQGESVTDETDPELTIDIEHYLPDDYIDDIGLRLSLYRRFATADDEDTVAELAAEMEQRFGPAPLPAQEFVRLMALKPALRALRVLGCEASTKRVTLHLKQDTPLDPARVMPLVSAGDAHWSLTPDMKLTRRFPDGDEQGAQDAIDHIRDVLTQLEPLKRTDAAPAGAT